MIKHIEMLRVERLSEKCLTFQHKVLQFESDYTMTKNITSGKRKARED